MLHYLHIAVLLVFVLLQFADFFSSKYIFEKGFGHEANKWIAVMITRIGIVPGLVVAKCIAIAAIAYVWYSSPHREPLYVAALLGVVIWYLKVVWSNLAIIGKYKGWYGFST